jgi:hypothetical protein
LKKIQSNEQEMEGMREYIQRLEVENSLMTQTLMHQKMREMEEEQSRNRRPLGGGNRDIDSF